LKMIYLLYYTHRDLGGFAGKTNAFIIRIHVDYKDDRGLLEHEKIHVKQFWKNPLHGLFYKFSKDYRLKSEVEAYRKQIEYGADLDQMAWLLWSRYDLKITLDEARDLLEE